jgi:ERCC4-type nuclease
MKIIIDERERDLLSEMTTSVSPSFVHSIEHRMLELGDVLITDDAGETLLIIERKTLFDLLASIKDGRYKEQSLRLQHCLGIPHRVIYIIEGIYYEHSPSNKQIIYSAMVSLNQFKGFSVVRTQTIFETADIIFNMVDKLSREFKKGNSLFGGLDTEVSYSSALKSAKKENITRNNIGAIMLSQVPGVSIGVAQQILQMFDNDFFAFLNALQTDPNVLNQLKIDIVGGKKMKLRKDIIQSIYTLIGK